MLAIISDIHGNLEALEAVLRMISADGVDEIWCLGDIVGYGPNPRECIDLVERNCTLSLMGNHDWAVLNSPTGFNSVAARMIYRTKEWLQATENSSERERHRWEFLSELGLQSIRGEFALVHASPRAALSEYVLPTDVDYDRGKLYDIFDMTEHFCVVGHTHVPCCITEDLQLVVPKAKVFSIELGEKKAIINIGSVGQPRDGDNRACYVTLDQAARLVTYHRVPYRTDRTVEKLGALGEGYEVLASRLLSGL
jgi:predicted phosphodiesterase